MKARKLLLMLLLAGFVCCGVSAVVADEIIDDGPVEYTMDEEDILDDGPVEYMMGDDEEIEPEEPPVE